MYNNDDDFFVESTRAGVKRRWSETERDAFQTHFASHLKNSQMANGEEIKAAINKDLKHRSIAQIRTRLHNFITKKQKMN